MVRTPLILCGESTGPGAPLRCVFVQCPHRMPCPRRTSCHSPGPSGVGVKCGVCVMDGGAEDTTCLLVRRPEVLRGLVSRGPLTWGPVVSFHWQEIMGGPRYLLCLFFCQKALMPAWLSSYWNRPPQAHWPSCFWATAVLCWDNCVNFV